MRLGIDPMVLLIVSSGIECSVSLTLFKNSSKFSLVMFLLKASACNISFMLNIFSVGFMSVLGQGMEISLHQYYQVQPWSSCCFDLGLQLVKKFLFRVWVFLKCVVEMLYINCANISPLIFPWYCSKSIIPRLNAIATRKCATLPPEPT